MELCACIAALRDQPRWILVLSAVGLLSLLKRFIAALQWLFVSFLRPGKNLARYGSWAVVTGSTDGIGLALAFQLAGRGLNLVLVGRNPDKLREVNAGIREKYPKVRVETVLIDFAGDLVEGVGRLKKAIEGMDVGILVNSAGISYPYAKYFHEVDEELIKRLIKVNVEGMTRVTHAVLPGMVERKRGAILNVGSAVAVVLPSEPLYAVYAATKSYIDHFSRSLHVEYKGKGIDVQCQSLQQFELFIGLRRGCCMIRYCFLSVCHLESKLLVIRKCFCSSSSVHSRIISLLKTSSCTKHLKQTHGRIITQGMQCYPSILSATTLCYISFALLDSALLLFQGIPNPSGFLWNMMIRSSATHVLCWAGRSPERKTGPPAVYLLWLCPRSFR